MVQCSTSALFNEYHAGKCQVRTPSKKGETIPEQETDKRACTIADRRGADRADADRKQTQIEERDRVDKGPRCRRWENFSRRENKLFPGGVGKDFLI
jgi:hypothetical protein